MEDIKMPVIEKIDNICYYINFDELGFNPKKEFSDSFLEELKDIFHEAKIFGLPLILIVCTQNSKSCTKKHFQHMLKDKLFGGLADQFPDSKHSFEGIHLIDKADATASSNSSITSCLKNGNKPAFNCRTRIYGNKYVFSKKSQNSNGNIEKEKLYIRELPKFNGTKDNVRTSFFETDKSILRKREISVFIEKCEKRIISLRKDGVGGILFNIILRYENTDYTYIICNSNLPESNSKNILKNLKEGLIYNTPLRLIMVNPGKKIIKDFNKSNIKINIFPNINK